MADHDPLLERAARAAEKLRLLQAASAPRSAPDVDSTRGTGAFDGAGFDVLELEAPGTPADWALCRSVAADMAPAGSASGYVPASPKFVSQIVSQIPAVAQAVARGGVFELIGPASVLRGLRDGTLELIPSQAGGVVGGVRKVGTSAIAHQARFQRRSLLSAVGPQLLFSLVTAAVGAAHLAEIHKQLARINTRLDLVLEGQQSERHGTLAAAVGTLQEIAAQHTAAGSFTPAMLQRLLLVERDVRRVREHLRHLHETYRARSLESADLASLEDAFGKLRAIVLHDARLTIIAEAALVVVERLMLAYELEHESANAVLRQNTLADLGVRRSILREELSYLGSGLDQARLRLGELGESPRRLVQQDRRRRLQESLEGDRALLLDLDASIASLGEHRQDQNRVQVVRVRSEGAKLHVWVGDVAVGAEEG
ncbi:MAG: hypothetical protein Q8M65_05995 [Rhodoglobus sp.]|nr:hypothetical protein [Rhodoglobus sp.]